MASNAEPGTIEGAFRAAVIVWLAILFSQFLFVFLIFIIKPELFNFDALAQTSFAVNPVIIALGFIGLTTFALSFVLKARLLRQAIEKQNIGGVQSAMIVAVALCEATSLFGLVSAMAFDFRYFFAFFAVGILGVLLHFPRRASFQAASFKKLM